MDDTDQQNEVETVPKCTDGDSSLKGSVDDNSENVKHLSPKRSSCNASSSEKLAETFSANGPEKKTNEGDTPEVLENFGSKDQEEKSTDCQLEKSNKELSEVSDNIENSLMEICEGVEASKENSSDVILNDCSNLSKRSNCSEKNEEEYRNQLGNIINQLNDNTSDVDQNKQPDLNENKESCGQTIENIEETEIINHFGKEVDDTSDKQNRIKEIVSVLVDVEEPKADPENIEKAGNNLLELSSPSEEVQDTTNILEPDFCKVSGELVDNSSQSEIKQSVDNEDKGVVISKIEIEDENLIQFSPLKSTDFQNKLETGSVSEVVEESKNFILQEEEESEKNTILAVSTDLESNTCEGDLQEKVETDFESNTCVGDLQEKVETDFESNTCVGDLQEKVETDLESNTCGGDLQEKVETDLQEKVETDLESNTCGGDLQENVETDQEKVETDLPECEKGDVDIHNKSDTVEDFVESQVNESNNSDEQDEENKSKGENEGNELMDTEMVNCNEIDQIELNENEFLKEKEIDRIQIELTENGSKGEVRNSEMIGDTLSGEDTEEAQETQADEILENEFSNTEQDSNAEETFAGYTTDLKDKDEENCIIPDIPDEGILKLTSLHQITRETRKSKGENDILKGGKIAVVEKPKTRAQDKKSEVGDASKPRPIRSAAKLAENKIRSLVANDMVFEDGTYIKDFDDQVEEEEEQDDEEEDDQVNDEESTECAQCGQVKICKLTTFQNIGSYYICSDACVAAFKILHTDKEPTDSEKLGMQCNRKCSQCNDDIIIRNHRRLFWETMDFCDEDCLARYQHRLGSHCANCKGVVGSCIGKYCVRFGFDIKQFCSGVCLEEYKKGLKVCSYCQKDISTGVEGFLAPVGSKNKFKDFCSQSCMEKYEQMSSTVPLSEIIEECAVCSNKKPVQVQVELDEKTHKLCSEPCFAAFKFVNNITEGQCEMCRKYYDCSKTPKHVVRINFYDEACHAFCSKTCLNVYILANRAIVPCNWCKIKKYDFDMIKQINSIGQLIMMCSITCLMSYRMSVKPSYLPRMRCGFCIKNRKPLYYLTMTDSSTRYFCNSTCVMAFQNCYKKKGFEMGRGSGNVAKPIGGPKRMVHPKPSQKESTCIPIISSVQSLASNSPAIPTTKVTIPRPDQGAQTSQQLALSIPAIPTSIPPRTPPSVRQQIIVKPPETKEMKNKSILCKPYSHTKGVSCRPHPCMKETQTDESLNRKFLIPIPIPIYVPAPMHMFATPFPVPVPFPLPIPVPIFIPTTRNSAKGIMKEIKKIQEKIPTDPFEAELLMMAEMVAGDKKQDPTDSESEDGNEQEEKADGTFYPENVDTSNTFGDDMLQMALKMASELEEPAVDMESVLTSSTITTNTQPPVDPNKALYASDDSDQVNVMGISRGRKRSVRGSRNSAGGTPSKRGRRTSGSDVPLLPPPEPVPSRTIEVEKPDANMCLKYTFGVNAWRHWVMQKNAELEKAALTNRKIKLFKPDLLQLTADELNFSLCLFVKEVRKPNGTEYAPDTIYYLCLGIQQYLFENGRIDNIFTDSYYEKFTDCLDEVAKKFAALYNDSQYIVTRVEEEHLWESKQLGAHSPHVLLSTLMFFNTKHFNLVTVEEHMQLSFSHIMKHWKRNPNTPGVAKAPGSRNVLLRFYPPQSALEANSRKKKVYEQQENEENPLRCPVKLYEFYLSKCPESVKTRNDVFYLLPERSCVPDSPVWYSTMALGKEPLMKMLHRVKMVKEINIALLTS